VRPGVAITGEVAGMEIESGPWAMRGTAIKSGSIIAPGYGETIRIPYLDWIQQQKNWFAVQSDVTQRSMQGAWRLLAGEEATIEMGGYRALTPITPSAETTLTKFGASRVGPTIDKYFVTETFKTPAGGIPAGGLPVLSPTTFSDITSKLFRDVRPTQIYFPVEGEGVFGNILAGAAISMIKAPTTAQVLGRIDTTKLMSLPRIRQITSSFVRIKPIEIAREGAIEGVEPIAATGEITRIMEVVQPAQVQIQEQVQIQQLQQLTTPSEGIRLPRLPPLGSRTAGRGGPEGDFRLPRGRFYYEYTNPIKELSLNLPKVKVSKIGAAMFGLKTRKRAKGRKRK